MVPSNNQYMYCCQYMIYDNIQVLGVVSVFSLIINSQYQYSYLK